MATAVESILNVFGTPFRWVRGFTQTHRGIDLSAPTGTPVYAVTSGTVQSTNYQTEGGNVVKVDTGKLTAYYGHLHSVSVREGEFVTKGTQIGTVGSTGESTGPHLHFGLWDTKSGGFINPTSYLSNVDDVNNNLDERIKRFLDLGLTEDKARQLAGDPQAFPGLGIDLEGAVIFIGIILVGIVFVVTAGLINLKGKQE